MTILPYALAVCMGHPLHLPSHVRVAFAECRMQAPRPPERHASVMWGDRVLAAVRDGAGELANG